MKNTIFTGAGVAIVTPMNDDGSINYARLGELIEFNITNGTDAIIICGTTGESSTMSDDEHKECIKFAVEKVAGRVPVIAGTGSNDTQYAIELSQEAQELGADGLLVVTPYYNKTSQAGLVAHYTAIADSVNIPIILYNVPSRTGVNIAIDTIKTLSKHKNIVAIKEAGGSVDYALKIVAACGNDIDVYSGEDSIIVPMMSIGAKGVISVLSNVVPKETHEMCKAALENDFATAGKLQVKYNELINSLFCDVNPIPVKEALNIMGKNVGGTRLPLVPMSDAGRERLKSAMKNLNII